MRYRYFLSFFLGCTIFFGSNVHAQLVTDNAFLQGHWLEAAIAPNGSWGNSVTAPAGYHIHAGGSADYSDPILHSTASVGMDFNYDYQHDGFAAGSFTSGPTPWYGPYFLPGTPFDGWSMQVNGIMSSAFYTDAGFNNTLGGTLTGTVSSYTNTGGVISGVWSGTAGVGGALQITQTNSLDTNAAYLIVTTKFKNTSGTAMPGVYYFVSADPDNDETDSGGSFPTNNHIAYQNDYYHRVEVWARPPFSYHQNCFSGLATKDCRAKALIYESWPPPMVVGNDLDLVYDEEATSMGTLTYGVGSTTYEQDIAYGLVYNLGTIAAGDSAILSFAWIFTDSTGVDSAFPEPQIVTEGIAHDSLDTVVGCNVGANTFTASVINGNAGVWSWSHWTWAPSTGLSATTGTSVTVNLIGLSGPTVFTVTGTDTSSGSMTSCNTKVFYMYVTPCFHATNNGPVCLNDTLFLIAHGDSTGATYFWYGPGGFTGFTQTTYRTGMVMSDTGWYYVVKTLGTEHDTVSTHVALKAIPYVTPTNNTPICSGNTLSFSATPDSVGETFAWTGPNHYSGIGEYPNIPLVTTQAQGLYKVVTGLNGCFDSAYVEAIVDSTPAQPVLTNNTPLCSQRSPNLQFTVTDATPGVLYSWVGPLGFTSTMQTNVLPDPATALSGVYTASVYITYSDLQCSNSNSTVVTIDSTPVAPLLTSNSRVCTGDTLKLYAHDTLGSVNSWIGPDSNASNSTDSAFFPNITFSGAGIYSVTATYFYTVPLPAIGCISDTATISVVIDSTPPRPTASSNSPGTPSICQGDTLMLTSHDTTSPVAYIWTGPDSYYSTDQNPSIDGVMPAATGQYTVTIIYSGIAWCKSSTVISVSITPTPALSVTSNSPVCTGIGDTLFLKAISDPTATFNWTGPYVFRSTAQNPFRDNVIAEYGGIYKVSSFLNGCPSLVVNDTVVVNQTPPMPWVKWISYCLNYPAPELQASGDSILWYTSSTIGSLGSITPPIPATTAIGNTFYFATQTLNGCTSAVDSIQVSVFPLPSLSVSKDAQLCPNQTLTLTASDPDAIAYYHWAPNIYLSDTSTPSVTVNPETDVTYTVVATNEYGCMDTATVAVKVLPAAVITLGDSTTLYPGGSYQINSQGNCTGFMWYPATGLDNPYLSNPTATPPISTKYVVTATTPWGCIAMDSINIYVSDQSTFAMPNAFAPGSGPNGIFKVIVQGEATLNNFAIFDRWGVKVFETNDIAQGWDGTYNGKPQPQDVYIYQITAVSSSGQTFSKTGNVTLLR